MARQKQIRRFLKIAHIGPWLTKSKSNVLKIPRIGPWLAKSKSNVFQKFLILGHGSPKANQTFFKKFSYWAMALQKQIKRFENCSYWAMARQKQIKHLLKIALVGPWL